MNERIFELAKQADLIQWDTLPSGARTPDHESVVKARKFAELIVQECMTTILKESKWYWDKDEFESSNAIQAAARRVKEHFGVEE
jgi:hypothetical protein